MDICKHSEFCGGCAYQGIPYDEQLKIKEVEVYEYLRKRNLSPKRTDKIEGCQSPYKYRNKMEYTFGDLVKDGELTLGMHKKKHFMSIVTVDSCQLVHKDYNTVLRETLQLCKSQSYTKYHKRSHRGLLRHLVIRSGIRTGEMLINIVTTSEEGFDEKEFCNMIEGLSLSHKVVGILHTVNDRLSDAVYPDEVRILSGRDYYEEEMSCLRFKIGGFSFFQTNVSAAERLYKKAIELIGNIEGKHIWDLFCGTGTITQLLGQRAKSVLGVEIVEEAVQKAVENTKLNGLSNCKFIAGDVFQVMKELTDVPDIFVVDPPRGGMSLKALNHLLGYGVKTLLYVSCNPKTFAENAEFLGEHGYEIEYFKPFDNFPNTRHVECIALIQRMKS